MPDESTTPDPVRLTRQIVDAYWGSRDLDDALKFFAHDAVFDTTHALGLVFEWTAPGLMEAVLFESGYYPGPVNSRQAALA